jgi:inhibitor of cysteine peptidase
MDMNLHLWLNLLVFGGFLSFLIVMVLSLYQGLPPKRWSQQPWYPLALSGSLMALGIGTLLPRTQPLNPLLPKQIKQVLNQDHLLNLLTNSQANRDQSAMTNLTPGAAEVTDGATSGGNTFVDTNSQVAGIKEGDIIKTDGNLIYYASRWDSRIRVMTVDSQNQVDYVTTLSLTADNEIIYTESMYLTEEYLVVIGYRYDFRNDPCLSEDDNGDVYICPNFMWWQPTGSVVIIERETLEIVYRLRTNAAFIDHRIVPLVNDNQQRIAETLYLVGHHYLNVYDQSQDIRPYFIENAEEKELLSYSQMFYVEGDDLYAMTTFTGINLMADSEALTYQTSGYLGTSPDYKKLYVNQAHLYLAQANYHFIDNQSFQTTTIFKFALAVPEGTLTLTTIGTVRGTTVNQFALDEYQGQFRIATTDTVWNNLQNNWWWSWESRLITNRLYILTDRGDGTFGVTSLIEEGLGKPGESIMSVRFVGPLAYVVTFLRTDPLYIIDLSDPLNPIIREELYLPGYDTYQHPWGENHLIGLGYDADEHGVLTGLKLSAYDVSATSPSVMQTLNFSQFVFGENQEDDIIWGWSWAEALWDHKAITVSVDHGIFAFAVNAYSYRIVDQKPRPAAEPYRSDEEGETEPGWVSYEFSYHSFYLIFEIDFTNVNPIAEPVRIEHPISEIGYVQVDRGVIINDVIHTFSNQQMISYDLNEKVILQTLVFPEYR